MKYHSALVLFFCFSITAQGQHWAIKKVIPRLDTLCYPFEGGLQLIIINHEGYTAMQNENIAIEYSRMSSMPSYILSRDNEYLFRDSTGRIVKTFNRLNPSLDTLTSIFRDLKVNVFRDSIPPGSLQELVKQNSPKDLILDKDYFPVAKVPQIGGARVRDYYYSQHKTLEKNVGLINRSGELVIPYLYKNLKPLGNYYWAYQKDKVGIITAQNKELVPIAFDYYKIETNDHKLYTFWNENKCLGFFNLTTLKFTAVNGYEVIDYLERLEEYGFARVQKNGKYGSINKHFEEVIPIIYDEIGHYDDLGYCRVQKEGLYGFLDTTNKVIVPVLYPKIGSTFSQDRVWFLNDKGKYGFLDKNGKEIIPAQYDHILPFYGKNTVVYKDGLAAFINKKGDLLTPYQYKEVRYEKEQFVVKNTDGYMGVLNAQLKEIVPCLYQRVCGREICRNKDLKGSYWTVTLENDKQHQYTKEGARIN